MLPALARNDRLAVTMHLRLFKDKGVIRHDKTLQIPTADRIPALTASEAGYKEVFAILTMRLHEAFQNLNLRKGMDEDQLLNLAEKIIEESHEDNLAMEDVLLFLEQLVTGKCGKIYDRLDMPTFFELFEDYRERRHMALHYRQYEMHQQFKAMGDSNRSSEQAVREDLSFKRAHEEYNIKAEIQRFKDEQGIRPDAEAGGPIT